ncbi:MAG: biosynthetic-type acetolactate synthase large subunit [Bacteroidales bacterium]|nr:biosynthetic-type acetolactate synthase large subunit [Bacteroidales bacterium]
MANQTEADQQMFKGAEILLKSLLAEGVETIFGYPGGQNIAIYDQIYDYKDKLRHVLVRHEQGAIHSAQGYARAKGVPGVVLVTSGPGATNVVTGIADAMIDSTPLVVIAGQVGTALLGTDAFQETDVLGMTIPITKWSYQIRRPEDIVWAVARAFYIASSGRPGPVVLDFTRDAQVGCAPFNYEKCNFIRSYIPNPKPCDDAIAEAAKMLNASRKPFVVFGQGITIAGAEKELAEFLSKGDIPAGSTLLGLSALPSDDPHYVGMVGMHGNIAANVMTQECDVLLAVGMRFDDRVTGKLSTYAKQAKVIHIDIDAAEIGKNVPVDLGILGNAKEVLPRITELLLPKNNKEWIAEADVCNRVEKEKVIDPEVRPGEGFIKMGEAVDMVAKVSASSAIIVTDVGQNQMHGARYSRFNQGRSMITSGGLGTMGFGIPAAIGAKIAVPSRPVVLFVGDGGFQMTIEELGTIMQEGTGVKIVLLNNNWLGNVRMWQELFWNERYSYTRMTNPDYSRISSAYGIKNRLVEKREDLEDAVKEMLSDDMPFILEVRVIEEGMVFPMIPPGKSVDEIMVSNDEWFTKE